MHEELPSDPDNTPPRSRLFMVVPKSAEGSIIEVRGAGGAEWQRRHRGACITSRRMHAVVNTSLPHHVSAIRMCGWHASNLLCANLLPIRGCMLPMGLLLLLPAPTPAAMRCCPGALQAEMARFSGMQYCKTDLIATKGIVFVKYARSSSACLAMETIQETGMVRRGCCCLLRLWVVGGAAGTEVQVGAGTRATPLLP